MWLTSYLCSTLKKSFSLWTFEGWSRELVCGVRVSPVSSWITAVAGGSTHTPEYVRWEQETGNISTLALTYRWNLHQELRKLLQCSQQHYEDLIQALIECPWPPSRSEQSFHCHWTWSRDATWVRVDPRARPGIHPPPPPPVWDMMIQENTQEPGSRDKVVA